MVGNVAKGAAAAPLLRFAARLRFPWLFALTLALFVLDLFVPDLIPFVDEVLLGLGALLLGSLRRRQGRATPAKDDVIDVRTERGDD